MESEHCRVNREKLTFCWALEPAAATGGAADHSAPCRGDTGDVTPVSGHPAPASRDPAETRERDSVLSSVLDQEPPGADVRTPLPPGQSLSESVVSRVIGEIVRYPSNNYQLQQLVQSSLMVSLIYHLMLPWLFAFFFSRYFLVSLLSTRVSSLMSSLFTLLAPAIHSSPLGGLMPKIPRVSGCHLTSFTAESFFCWKSRGKKCNANIPRNNKITG